jgi:hypothetical protein
MSDIKDVKVLSIEEKKKKHGEHKKIWYIKNKDKLKEQYKANKNIILTKMKETVICNCGKRVNKCHLNRHKATKLHTNLMNKKIKIVPEKKEIDATMTETSSQEFK